MQHFIDDDTDGPDIYLVIVDIIACYFRGHIEESPDFGLSASDLVAETEVDDLYFIFSCYENVFWREISVDVPIFVYIFDCEQDAFEVFFGLIFSELFLGEDRPQFFASIFHKHFDIIFSFFMVEQLYDVGVMKMVQCIDFIFYAVIFFFVVVLWYVLLVDDFQNIKLILVFDDFHLAKSFVFHNLLHYRRFLQVHLTILGNRNATNSTNVHISSLSLYYIPTRLNMKAGKDKELDYLLINLCQQTQQPNISEAIAFREKQSLRKEAMTAFGTDQYHRFGPGVSLYFTLLKYLMTLFVVLLILSLPAMIVNMKGDGLALYGSSLGQFLMKTSLANQPSLKFEKEELLMQSHLLKLNALNISKTLLVLTDLLSILGVMCFVIYWRMKSEELISEMVKKQALPSYHTIVVELPRGEVTQEELKIHFQQFGQIRQVQFVYDYGNFLLEVKEFIDKVEKFSEEKDQLKKERQYDQIGEEYLKIKHIYKSATQDNVLTHQVPFSPTLAFVMFEDPELAQRVIGAYRYRVNSFQLDIRGEELKVRKCHVQPLSIIWQNYHLPACSEIKRSWLFGFLVAGILLITLFGIFVMSLHTSQKDSNLDPDLLGQVDYQTALNTTNPKKIIAFCAGLTYETFEWKYYSLCESYFNNFQHHWAYVLSISGVIVAINLFLIKIVFMLAELRRFRTLPQKKRFLTISIFLTYFFSSSLLAILIRAQINIGDLSVSLVGIAQSIFASAPVVEVYANAGRKWYLHIGKLLIVNYVLTLIVCPWLYVLEEWLERKLRACWARFGRTQREVKNRIVDPQFYWQFYYAIQMNAIFFGLMFSTAMPLFYLLTLLSIISLFFSSKIIFHRYTRQPQIYDHKMNSFMTRSIILALLLHSVTSYNFLSVEQIFPSTENFFISVKALKGIYIVVGLMVLGLFFCWKRVAGFIKKNSKKEELMITEEINSSFGAGSRELKEFQPRTDKIKHKITLVHEYRRDNYLNSYKMQDNPYYNNMSYTLLILYQTIIERKQPSIQNTHLRHHDFRQHCTNLEKGHQSMIDGPTERFIENERQLTERGLNQSI